MMTRKRSSRSLTRPRLRSGLAQGSCWTLQGYPAEPWHLLGRSQAKTSTACGSG